MQQRSLGTQGLTVSAIGYGSMGTVVGYGATDDSESVAAIRQAHDLGVTFFDTAEMYGWGDGEKLLGRAVAPFRDEAVIATKFGFTPGFGTDSRPEHIREVVETSLRNLGVDSIDVLYQHRLDPSVPIEDVVGAMAEFVDAGKVKYLGLSEATPSAIRRAHAVHPISVLQTEYSIFAPVAEPLFPLLAELGIGFVAYSPLARGFLTGTAKRARDYDRGDFRTLMDWWNADNYDANTRVVDQLTELAAGKGVTVSQLALAWILAQRDFIVPIPGSRNPDRVAQNVAAADIELTADDLARIAAIAPGGGHGDRGTPSPWL
ncbi:Aldo-keto reductase [Rhodococcus sp. RD6.2]|uniref:aldo/keto reductase n=1 Tax=Rhodococcus sp. RD6.2 TaxID=260936 RepID=UPI00063B5497|nr:aldo/keto reductase [Rhodococcus sp. RD6.2]CRK52132.1 Aldo-keto reductase [Rhodococcus sp. RD6.2]